MEEYSIGEYIIYRNGEKYELGRIKSLCEDGAFVAYHDGETGAKTPYSHMHKLINRYCIKDTSLGGDYFKADTPQPDMPKCRNERYYKSCKYKDNCNPTICFKALDEFQDAMTDCDHKCIQTEVGCERTDCPWK